MRTLLALCGAGNRGKTTTLGLLIGMIKAAHPAAGSQGKQYKHDATLIMVIDGVKVGIETQGDPGSRLGASLKTFVAAGCQVIVCASRSQGATVELVKSAAQAGYDLQWFTKEKAPPGTHDSANASVAAALFDAFEKALRAASPAGAAAA